MRRNPIRPKRNQKQIDFLMLSNVKEVLYGGAAGGGKSEALLMGALQFVEVPTYAAILFRKTYQDLALPGALMDRANEVLSGTSARWNGTNHTWTFPSGATLSFGYLTNEDDRFRYQGSEFQYIGFDELTQFKERDYTYLFSRLRKTVDNKVPLRMRAGTNPGGSGHLWVKKRFDPQGRRHPTPNRQFVGAKLKDNPYLDAEDYSKTSLSQLDSQTRKQYEHGDWTDFGGNFYFPDLWPRYIDCGDAYRIPDGPGRWRHIRKIECCRLLTLDWAMGKPKKGTTGEKETELDGDCTAFTIADMTDDDDGLLFYLYTLNERIPLGRNAPRLAELCRRWKPIVVGADDDNLSETMALECRRFREIPSIKPIKIGGRNKLTRSQAAIVRAERGKMYLPDLDTSYDGHINQVNRTITQRWVETLGDSLAAFTGADGEADDIADTVSIMGRLADEFRPGENRDEDYSALGSDGYNGEGNYNSESNGGFMR